MVASSVDELRVALEREATELAGRRDRLQEELALVEAQLAARLSAVEQLALIRPLTAPAPAEEAAAEPVAEAEVAPASEPAPEAEPVVEAAPEAEATASPEPVVEATPEPAAPETPAATVPAPRRKKQAVAAVAEQTRIQSASARKAPAGKPAARKSTRTKAGATAKATTAKPSTTKPSATKRAGAKAGTATKAAKATPVAKATDAPAPAPAAAPAARPVRSHLRDEIAALLAGTGEPMNVRQLTEALGEVATKSRMESVRTSTEGLVKAGRAVKTGRGLFTGPAA
ncbi:hypothetical protein [Embleya hyalina]|uniref:Uncharacterized protein n=1 Tax=Embleya hyalina TaxID=516124 RepID=A0A401YPS4_9ACTN|nr:hypothetical protein [Embleya hyalina]GCD96587.1 hypothetical protein EHYA_04274 [Embleya hyalina]